MIRLIAQGAEQAVVLDGFTSDEVEVDEITHDAVDHLLNSMTSEAWTEWIGGLDLDDIYDDLEAQIYMILESASPFKASVISFEEAEHSLEVDTLIA